MALIALTPPAAVELPTNLKLIQVPASGWETWGLNGIPFGIPICNVGGHESAVAEYCLAQALRWRLNLAVVESNLQMGSWRDSGRLGGKPRAEMRDAKIALVGYGAIGRALHRLLEPLGVQVLVANRTHVDAPKVARYFPLNGLKDMFLEADVVVASLGAHPETTKIIAADELHALGPRGLLVNVGRGSVIDHIALLEALRTQVLGSAVLDVWPDGAHSSGGHSKIVAELLALPNVTGTPQIAGWTQGTAWRRLEAISLNVQNAALGLPLMNVVGIGQKL